MASEATIQIQSNGHTLTLPTLAFQGLPSTLCKGCGHNSITSHLIEACKSIGVNPYTTVKLSGIGCSSKTPAYFLQYSHGFNALHGRMPSVATGAALANRKLVAIGISGDGDTANIGMGQFKHACRRNVPLLYIVENITRPILDWERNFSEHDRLSLETEAEEPEPSAGPPITTE